HGLAATGRGPGGGRGRVGCGGGVVAHGLGGAGVISAGGGRGAVGARAGGGNGSEHHGGRRHQAPSAAAGSTAEHGATAPGPPAVPSAPRRVRDRRAPRPFHSRPAGTEFTLGGPHELG